jgi:hypothetical protein
MQTQNENELNVKVGSAGWRTGRNFGPHRKHADLENLKGLRKESEAYPSKIHDDNDELRKDTEYWLSVIGMKGDMLENCEMTCGQKRYIMYFFNGSTAPMNFGLFF